MKLPVIPNAGAIDRIHAALTQPGGCIVQGMDCDSDAPLEELARALGEPLCEPHNVGGGMVCRIEVENGPDRPYASTPWHFSAHTDCTDHRRPPEIVLLLCQTPARRGGDSFVAWLPEVLEQLTPGDLMALQEPQFYFRYGYLPILSLQAGSVGVRYSRQILDLFAPAGRPAAQLALLDRFEAATQAASFTFALAAGDCLILDNRRALHGREAFEDDGSRLLKRVRVYRG